MRFIPIQLNSQSHDVLIERNLLANLGDSIRQCPIDLESTQCAVVTDTNVARHHLQGAESSLRSAGWEPVSVVLPAGEANKTLAAVQHVHDRLLAIRVERGTPLIGLGGGVVTDIAGLAAATLLRGLPYLPVPTSLLAMVDAAIGGKNGVNHAAGKNLIGTIHPPAAVLIDPDVLKTLPAAELRHGLAEVIKHYAIADADGFARLEACMPKALQPDLDILTDLIAENVTIKGRIVQADPLETGVRAHLNFGHTFGHAIEKAASYTIPHGQAIAIGMVAACEVSVTMGLIARNVRDRVAALIAAAGLPVRAEGLDPAAVIAAMASDKKVRHGRVRFVLLERLGAAVLRDDVPEAVVASAVGVVVGRSG